MQRLTLLHGITLKYIYKVHDHYGLKYTVVLLYCGEIYYIPLHVLPTVILLFYLCSGKRFVQFNNIHLANEIILIY